LGQVKQLYSKDVIKCYTRQGAISQIVGGNASSNLEATEALDNALAKVHTNVFASMIV